MRRTGGAVKPSLSPASLPSWRSLVCGLKPCGPAGVGLEGEALVWRNRNGRAAGMLFLDGDGYMVVVEPRYRRTGVASRLLSEAQTTWPHLDPGKGRFTPAGAAFVNAWLGLA